MTTPFATISYEKTGDGVAHLSLNRPRRRNAYSVAMRDDFAEALYAAALDDEIRALLITGQGPAFCAGADLSEFGSAPSQTIARRVRWQRDVWGQLIDLPKPIVAAAHGYCIGSGLELMLLADVRIAAADAIFAMPELHLGMIPAAGGTQTLPASSSPATALDLLLTGRRFTAAAALRYRLISRVVPPGDLSAAAWQIARRLATIPPAAAAAMRAALRDGPDLPLAYALDLERRLAASLLPASPGDGNAAGAGYGNNDHDDYVTGAAPSVIQ